MTYRIRVDTTDPASGDATVSVDKIITQDVLRAVLVAMMQAEAYQEALAAYEKQRQEERQKRLKEREEKDIG